MTPRSLAARGVRRASASSGSSNGLIPGGRPVLIVDDSRFSAKLVKKGLFNALGCQVEVAHSFLEAKTLLRNTALSFYAAVADLSLPDAPNGEVIDLLLEAGVPTVVLTAHCNQENRERIISRGIVDYHVKDAQSLSMVVNSVLRLVTNPAVKILVVDDSSYVRKLLEKLLKAQLFQILQASSGEEGIQILQDHPEVRLAIVDYQMPGMTGVEMVSRVRRFRQTHELAILGVSALGSGWLSAHFLKHGADDFIAKPFLPEELYCRVYRSLDTLTRIEELRKSAFTDQLTGLSNRLYFFRTIPKLYRKAVEQAEPFWVAMIDIDHFKSINDTYGHAGGDEALRGLAALFRERLPKGWSIARFGGEEFCLVARGLDWQCARHNLEELRQAVEENIITFEGREIRFTISLGCTDSVESSLDDMINLADRALYEAKETGRNKLTFTR
jgi:diguanylate cyclase (GGDEF)-like protein